MKQFINADSRRSLLRAALAAATVLIVSACASDKVRVPAQLGNFTPTLTVRQAWTVNVGKSDGLVFQPYAISGNVYATAADGTLTRIDAATGRVLWQVRASERLAAGPGSDGVITAVASTKGRVFAFDANGRQVWSESVGSEVITPPLVGKDNVIVRTIDNRVIALDAQGGKRRWMYQRAQAPLTLRTAFGMAFAGDSLVTGFAGGKLGAIGLGNGALRWETTVAYAKGFSDIERLIDVAGTPAVRGNVVCAAAFQGRVGCFDLRNGEPIWGKDFSTARSLASDGELVFAADEKSHVSAFDARDGRLVWRNDQLSWRSLGEPMLLGRSLVVGDFEGNVHLLSRQEGKFIARLKTDGTSISAAPVLAGQTLVVQTRGGNLFGFAPD